MKNNNTILTDVFYQQVAAAVTSAISQLYPIAVYKLPDILRVTDQYDSLWKDIRNQHMESAIGKRFAKDVRCGAFSPLSLVGFIDGTNIYQIND